MKTLDVKSACIVPDSSLCEAITCIDREKRGIALVVDTEGRLVGTITDGDIRRAILAGLGVDTPIAVLLARKANSLYPHPVTAPVDTSPEALLQLMKDHVIRHIPLLDESGRVAGLVTLDELMPGPELPMQAVIMAGGLGTRLRPLTEAVPKPMLPVGGRPLMERIIGQLKLAGIRRVNVTTHYRPEKITEYFGDGRAFGVELNYVNEDHPLGTAGALGLISAPEEPLLVINGDILTEVDFRAMLAYHQDHQAKMTVAVRRYEVQVPYGVLECEGAKVREILEKPKLNVFVNAGIYLLGPLAHRYIPNDERFDMTDLIQRLLEAGELVVSFPIREYWLDVGQHMDYEQAQTDVKNRMVTQ